MSGGVRDWRMGTTVLLAATALAGGCQREARSLDATQPQSAPNGPADPRESRYQASYYQVAQGGRYFSWYGCTQCHGQDATGVLNLQDMSWRHGSSVDKVYAFIAHGHPGALAHYGERTPPEQIWQLTAFVRDMPLQDPAKLRRQNMDTAAEPQAEHWAGPVK